MGKTYFPEGIVVEGVDLAADKADKTNVLELDNTTPFTPTGDEQPATKKYVDDSASTATSIQGVAVVDTIPTDKMANDRSLNIKTAQNLIANSEDISQATHTKIRMIPSGTSGLIATSVAGSHAIGPANNFAAAGVKSVRYKAKEGAKSWFATSNTSTGKVCYFGQDELIIRSQTAGTKARISQSDETGWIYCEFSCEFQAGSNGLFIYVAEDDAVISYTGDNVTISGYVKEIQFHDGDIDEDVPYVKTEASIIEGEQLFDNVKPSQVDDNQELTYCIGDSITQGVTKTTPSISYAEILSGIYPKRKFISTGIGGDTTDDIVRTQVLNPIKTFKWIFNKFSASDNLYPWTEQNDAILSIDTNTLKIERDATASASGQLQLLQNYQTYTISGTLQGDGTSNPTVESSVSGVLFAGTSSVSDQEFNVEITTGSNGDSETIDIVVNGGVATNFIRVKDFSIKLEDAKPVADNVVLMSGTNDVVGAVSNADIQVQTDFALSQISQAGAKAVIMETTPSDGYVGWSGAQKIQLQELRSWQMSSSKASHIVRSRALGDDSNELKSFYDSGDGLHPNYAGTVEIAQLISEYFFENSTQVITPIHPFQNLHGELLGNAPVTTGYFVKSAINQNNPGGEPLTTNDTWLNGQVAPYQILENSRIKSIKIECAAAAVSSSTVGSAPLLRLDLYKHSLSSRTLLTNGTIRVPLLSGLSSVGIYNDITGGTESVVFEIVDPDDIISLIKSDLVGYEFVGETTDNNSISAIGKVIVDALTEKI